MLQNSGNVDNLTGHYVFFLGCARRYPACPAQLSPAAQGIPRAVSTKLDLPLFPRTGLPALDRCVRLYSHGLSCSSPQSRRTVWISGTVQTVFYCDFFYYYIKSWRNNEKLKLPA